MVMKKMISEIINFLYLNTLIYMKYLNIITTECTENQIMFSNKITKKALCSFLGFALEAE